MNVYDFDKTIYNGDSTVDFIYFCIRKYPKSLRHLPIIIKAYLKYLFHLCDKTQMKEEFFGIFKYFDAQKEIKLFWDSHLNKIFDWYLAQQKEDDLIISASPLFDIEEAMQRLNIKHFLASEVDPQTGKYTGLNCHGEQKVKRFKEVYGTKKIAEFYSDSYSDTPLAELAEEAYLVKKNGERVKWFK